MKLKSFGCSFIYGDELPDASAFTPSALTWPSLLAKHLGREYECYAKNGIGNLEILDILLSNLSTDSVYVINWSWPQRYSYISNARWKTLHPNDTEHDSNAILYYRNLHDNYTDKLNLLSCIATAASILEEKNLRYIMTYMNDDNITPTFNEPALKTLYSNALLYLTHWEGHGFNTWCEINKFEKCPGRHWAESTQIQAFEYIKTQIYQKGL